MSKLMRLALLLVASTPLMAAKTAKPELVKVYVTDFTYALDQEELSWWQKLYDGYRAACDEKPHLNCLDFPDYMKLNGFQIQTTPLGFTEWKGHIKSPRIRWNQEMQQALIDDYRLYVNCFAQELRTDALNSIPESESRRKRN